MTLLARLLALAAVALRRLAEALAPAAASGASGRLDALRDRYPDAPDAWLRHVAERLHDSGAPGEAKAMHSPAPDQAPPGPVIAPIFAEPARKPAQLARAAPPAATKAATNDNSHRQMANSPDPVPPPARAGFPNPQPKPYPRPVVLPSQNSVTPKRGAASAFYMAADPKPQVTKPPRAGQVRIIAAHASATKTDARFPAADRPGADRPAFPGPALPFHSQPKRWVVIDRGLRENSQPVAGRVIPSAPDAATALASSPVLAKRLPPAVPQAFADKSTAPRTLSLAEPPPREADSRLALAAALPQDLPADRWPSLPEAAVLDAAPLHDDSARLAQFARDQQERSWNG